MQASQAQMASQAAELDCKAALIVNLRSDITAACSEIEALSQAIPVLAEPAKTPEPVAESQVEEPVSTEQPNTSPRRLIISLPIFLAKCSFKIGVIAAGTLLAEKAYVQHCNQQPAPERK